MLTTDAGQTIHARKVLVAAGAWSEFLTGVDGRSQNLGLIPTPRTILLAKLDAVCQKINHVRYPEGFTWDDAKFKALVRIRIPLEEIKEEAKKEDDGEGEEEEQEEEAPPPTTPKEKPVNESKHDTTEGGDGERHPEWSKDTIPAQIIPAGEEKKWKEVMSVQYTEKVRLIIL